MPNARLEIDDSIIRRQLLVIPDDQVDDASDEFLPFWNEKPKELKTLFPSLGFTEKAEAVKPIPGICVKTKSSDNSKVFVNVCTSETIPPPEDITDHELVTILDSDAPSDFKVPMSIGQGHKEKDKGGADCTAYDIIINPAFFTKMLDNPLFHNFFMIATIEGLEEKYELSLDKNGWTVLKNKKYHGVLPEQIVRTKVPLVQELSSIRQWKPEDLSDKERGSNPLITELDSPTESDPLITKLSSKSISKSTESSKSDSNVLISEVSSKSLLSEISSKSISSKNTQSNLSPSEEKCSNKPEPKYSLDYINKVDNGDNLHYIEVEVELPDTPTGNKVSVKLSENHMIIETCQYYLEGCLPHRIDSSKSTGHFITSTKELLITLPVLR